MYFEPNVDATFSFEEFLRQSDIRKDEGRDTREICRLHLKGECYKGRYCSDRHMRPEKGRVCEYWLRGICKKEDKCEFMHEFDINRMPECFFFANYGECLNPECVFVHVGEEEIKECPYYKRGFCSMGPRCKWKHVRAVFCPNFMAGFCMEGKMCKYAHPKFNYPQEDELADKQYLDYIPQKRLRDYDEDFPMPKRPYTGPTDTSRYNDQGPYRRDLDNVICFKCGERGHYANVCTYRGPPVEVEGARQSYQNRFANMQCYNCGEYGHQAAYCPRRT